MSTIAASVQDTLPFDIAFDIDGSDASVTEPVYDEAAREADRTLCRLYFKAWCGSFGRLDGQRAGHPEISFKEFQAAAERLAEGVPG